MTKDGSTLATIENGGTSDIWALPDGDSIRAKQITSGGAPVFLVSTLGNDRVVYHTINNEIFSISMDGGNSVQLGGNDRRITWSNGCADGKHIVYRLSGDQDSNIWRMDADGTSPTQLTHEKSAALPLCSPDGQQVTYYNQDARTARSCL